MIKNSLWEIDRLELDKTDMQMVLGAQKQGYILGREKELMQNLSCGNDLSLFQE